MNREDLNKILKNHKHWLKRDCEDWYKMKADLRDADLCWANLTGADFLCADLRGANLSYANLLGADLRHANLSGANLSNANLHYANLLGADLRDVDFNGADLRDAEFRGANLSGAKNVPFIPYTCPEVGSFIGYKKAWHGIVELEILSDSKRCSSVGRKCRCDKAKVLGIYDKEHNLLDRKETVSYYDSNFKYVVGEIVEEPNYCEDRWNECSEGIHFFINFQEAVDYKN